MSDVLKLIPEEREFVPVASSHDAAIRKLEEFAPEGEEVEVKLYPHLEFIDQGECLEAILCPSCKHKLILNFFSEDDPVRVWWEQVNLDADLTNGEDVFELNQDAVCRMPCCQQEVKFIDLQFEEPAGFAKFELSIWEPEIDSLSDEQLRELEKILGCRLKLIWAHY
jgi:hypothetical protein